ncbi:MAG: tyrosine phenol-lyase [Gemmatimonadetes bacterium]|nr:tyrosine phenol-lyase [Gemmatimonadota bacterium]
MSRTIIEPFRIKVVEPIGQTSREERRAALEKAGYNLFMVPAEKILIDLLTDSGTGAMSSEQWAGLSRGDESYAGARSFYRFRDTVREIFGFQHIIPVHQGRAAEKILFGLRAKPGQTIPSNTHFDTTRANIEWRGATALDLPVPEAENLSDEAPFKGNMNLAELDRVLSETGEGEIPVVMTTITNNSLGGHPVSLENLRGTVEICERHGVPGFVDAARFAENAYLVKRREPGQSTRSIPTIAREQFSGFRGCLMSAKKDGIANIGGFFATDDADLAEEARQVLVVTEGFPTYGGLAGRDLEAIAIGLREVLEEPYLEYRIASTAYLADHLHNEGVPVVRPAGGHAVYLDARRFLSHLDPTDLPGQALTCALYLHAGIRACEIGTVMFGTIDSESGELEPAPHDLVRLAIPRRVYTQSQMDLVIESILELHADRERIPAMRMAWSPSALRHFTARFEPAT